MKYSKLSAAELNEKLKGQVIKRVVLNPFPDGKGGTATNPVVIFESYSALRFNTQETDVGDYGIDMIFREDETGVFYTYGKEEEGK